MPGPYLSTKNPKPIITLNQLCPLGLPYYTGQYNPIL